MLNSTSCLFLKRYPKHALPGAFFEDERVKSMPIHQLAEHLCAIVRSANVPSVGLDEGSTFLRKTLLDRKLNILCLHGFRLALFVFVLLLICAVKLVL
jgi:hypothetical protein